jgi:hypothetical protein
VLTSGVVRGLSTSTIARALAMGVLVAGCAQIAELGSGTEPTKGTNPDGGPDPVKTDDPNVEIKPSALVYGEVACGTDGSAKLITIFNNGGGPVNYSVQVPTGTSFRLEGEKEGKVDGIVAPKGNATVSVLVNPRVAGDNSADLIVTAGVARPVTIHVSANGSGPTFELAQSTIAFGDVRKENGAPPVDVDVKNNGTEAVSVASFVTSNPAFDVKWAGMPGPFTVARGATAKFNVALVAAQPLVDDAAPLSATIKPGTTKFCGPPPILTVSGRRVTSDVTVNPADWGKQGCGTTPGAKDIVITNYASAAVTYSVPTPPVAFTIVNVGPLLVAAAPSSTQPQTASIRVQPKTLGVTAPLLNVNELLGVMLASTAPGVSGKRDVPLHVDTRGAIVTVAPASLAFSSDGTKTDTKTFKLDNAGNESVFLNWSIQRTGGTWDPKPPGYVGSGGSANGSVGFTAAQSGTTNATLLPSQVPFLTVTACSRLPNIALSGTKP